MSGKQQEIQVLPQDVANMIAAGEVVERPASVVKELLENAVDAAATAIVVEISQGGSNHIRVSDNGSGIPRAQLERAFHRHATSKLQKAEDLSQISTLGFRGEALAAISAVSKIQVTSSTNQEELALKLHLEGGVLVKTEEIASPVGTTMVVEDLFFNTPARKKFMKSERSEGSAIFSLVQELALSHPEISIKFIREGKEEMKTTGDGTLESAIFHVLGKSIAAGLREISLTDRSTSLTGFVSLPSCCRASRSFQHFFVNGRYVKSPMMVAAMEEAYKNQKMVGRFPAGVLHLSLNYDEVDVNVHPAKTQVKFAHEKEIFQVVYRGVLNGLSQYKDIQKVELSNKNTISNQLPQLQQKAEIPNSAITLNSPLLMETPLIPVNSPLNFTDFTNETIESEEKININPKKDEISRPKLDFDFNSFMGTDNEEPLQEETVQLAEKPLIQEEISNPKPLEGKKEEETSIAIAGEKGITSSKKKEKSLVTPENQEEYEEITLDNTENDQPWRVVGEFFRTYIAVEVGDEIFLVDKHAAHERMNFERLKAQDYKPMAQVLMKPIVVQVSPEEIEILLENTALLQEFSFEIEEFSLQSIVIREAPYDVDLEKVGDSLIDLARKLISGYFPDPSSARDHLLHSIACKSAIKAGYLTQEAEQNVLAKIVMEDKVRHCPHGRPIVASLSKKELEKKFKRIQ